MTLRMTCAGMLALAFISAPVHAQGYDRHGLSAGQIVSLETSKDEHQSAIRDRHSRHHSSHRRFAKVASSLRDPKPHAWCGWWMRHHLGVADRRGNLARWWAGFGTRAAGPAVGTLVVWRHHVGIITGGSPGAWVVKSGNDGRAVRERVRSVAGAIAFRWPSRWADAK